MTTFQIRHRTRYTYDAPVTFGPHRLMIRPRDGHDMRILESSLVLRPDADVRWAFDTFGNSVALVTFEDMADELLIDSELTVRRYGHDEPLTRIARHAGAFPVLYDSDDRTDLVPFLTSQYPEDQQVIERLQLTERLKQARLDLDRYESAEYLQSLRGCIGVDPAL